MAKNQNPAPSAPEEAPEKIEPKSTTEVAALVIQGLKDDVTAPVTEINEPLEKQRELQEFSKDTLLDAVDENRKRDFVREVLQARAQQDAPAPPTPAIPPQVAEQTRLEMEAGRKRVAEFEALKPPPQPKENSTMQAVFRPSDYVPDPKKGQGVVATSTYRTL